jgi:hypothetical protein
MSRRPAAGRLQGRAEQLQLRRADRGRPCGAFTYYALKALKTLPAGATYADWHAAINPAFLPSASYPQSPQIFGSEDARKRKIFTDRRCGKGPVQMSWRDSADLSSTQRLRDLAWQELEGDDDGATTAILTDGSPRDQAPLPALLRNVDGGG